YPATYWLISEGLFCIISAATLLLAMQIGEGRQQWWRVALLAVLCAAAVTVRWAGVIGMLLVAAALFQGEWRMRLRPRQWIALALTVAVTGTTFVTLRLALRVTAQEAKAAGEFGGAAEDSGGTPAVALT